MILTLISFLLRFKQYIIYIVAVLAIIAALWYVQHLIATNATLKYQLNEIEQNNIINNNEQIKFKSQLKEKQNEISTKLKRDNDALVDKIRKYNNENTINNSAIIRSPICDGMCAENGRAVQSSDSSGTNKESSEITRGIGEGTRDINIERDTIPNSRLYEILGNCAIYLNQLDAIIEYNKEFQ